MPMDCGFTESIRSGLFDFVRFWRGGVRVCDLTRFHILVALFFFIVVVVIKVV